MSRLFLFLERQLLGLKLNLGFGLLAIITLLFGVGSLYMQQELNDEIQALYNDQWASVSLLKETQLNLSSMGRAVRQLMLSQNPAERERARKLAVAAESGATKNIEAMRVRFDGDALSQDVTHFEEHYGRYRRNVEHAIALYDQGGGLSAEAHAFIAGADFQVVALDAAEVLNGLARKKEQEANALVSRARQRFESWRWLMSIGLAVGVGLSLLLAFLIGRSIKRPSEELADVVDLLAQGKLDHKVPLTDYPNEIGRLARSIEVLLAGAREMQLQRWIKTGEAEVGAALQDCESFVDLAQRFLSAVGPMLQIGQAAFYIHEESQRRLRLLAGYAWRHRKHLEQYFSIGQGLVGQCAIERQVILLSQPPEGYLEISSSLGEATPGCIMVLPVLSGSRLLGVIELAALKTITAEQQALLEGVLPVLAMGMENFERNSRTRILLEQTKAQAASVEAQAHLLEGQKVQLEQRQAELAETEAWFKSIIESSPDGLLVVDAGGAIILANPQASLTFGYEIGELLGMQIEQLVPLAERGTHGGLREAYVSESQGHRAMAGDRSNLKGLHKSGRDFSIEVSLSRLPNMGGRQGCVCAAVRDVDERKRLEKAIRDSESRMRQVLDSSPAGVSIMTSNGKQVYSNQRLAELLGFSVEQMKSRRSSEFWAYPEDRARFLEQISREGGVSNFEALFKRSDGQLASFLLSTNLIEMLDGNYLVSWFYDVTALKTAEAALADQMNFQQALLDTIPYPLFYKGADSRFLGFNKAYEQTFGVDRTQLIGKRVLDLDYLPEADRIAYQAEDEAVIQNQGKVQRQMLIPFADGSMHETLYFVSGVIRDDGSPGGLVGTFVDMAPIKGAMPGSD